MSLWNQSLRSTKGKYLGRIAIVVVFVTLTNNNFVVGRSLNVDPKYRNYMMSWARGGDDESAGDGASDPRQIGAGFPMYNRPIVAQLWNLQQPYSLPRQDYQPSVVDKRYAQMELNNYNNYLNRYLLYRKQQDMLRQMMHQRDYNSKDMKRSGPEAAFTNAYGRSTYFQNWLDRNKLIRGFIDPSRARRNPNDRPDRMTQG